MLIELQKYLDQLCSQVVALDPLFNDFLALLCEIQAMPDDASIIIPCALGIAFGQRIIQSQLFDRIPESLSSGEVTAIRETTLIAYFLGNLIDEPEGHSHLCNYVTEKIKTLVGTIIRVLQEQANRWLSTLDVGQVANLLLTLGLKPTQLLALEEDPTSCCVLKYLKEDALVRYYKALVTQLKTTHISQSFLRTYLWDFVRAFPHRINFIWAASTIRSRLDADVPIDVRTTYLGFIGCLQIWPCPDTEDATYARLDAAFNRRAAIEYDGVGHDFVEILHALRQSCTDIQNEITCGNANSVVVPQFIWLRNRIMRLFAEVLVNAIQTPTYQLDLSQLMQSLDLRARMTRQIVTRIGAYRVGHLSTAAEVHSHIAAFAQSIEEEIRALVATSDHPHIPSSTAEAGAPENMATPNHPAAQNVEEKSGPLPRHTPSGAGCWARFFCCCFPNLARVAPEERYSPKHS